MPHCSIIDFQVVQREAFVPLSREEETAVRRAFSANDSYDFDSCSLVYLL